MVDGANEAAEGLAAIAVEMRVGGPGDRLGEPGPSLERLQPGLRPVAEPGLRQIAARHALEKISYRHAEDPRHDVEVGGAQAVGALQVFAELGERDIEGAGQRLPAEPARRRRSSMRLPICTSR